MNEIQIIWEEFVEGLSTQQIKTWIDINKGHALMKAPFAPVEWRLTIKIMTFLLLLSFPIALILFFFIKWWIPLLIIISSFILAKALREEAAKAVIRTSLKDPKFYSHAILSGTLKIFKSNDNIKENIEIDN